MTFASRNVCQLRHLPLPFANLGPLQSQVSFREGNRRLPIPGQKRGEFPVETAPRPFHPWVRQRNGCRMELRQFVQYASEKLRQFVQYASDQRYSGKTEQEDILERQNKHKELTALYPRKGRTESQDTRTLVHYSLGTTLVWHRTPPKTRAASAPSSLQTHQRGPSAPSSSQTHQRGPSAPSSSQTHQRGPSAPSSSQTPHGGDR